MNITRILPFLALVGCGAASEPTYPQEQTHPTDTDTDAVDIPSESDTSACTPREVAWLAQGVTWHFAHTVSASNAHISTGYTLTLDRPTKTDGYTLYPILHDANENINAPDVWSYIGASTCGDIVVSDGKTVYPVYSATTDSWTGIGLWRSYDTSAMVYAGSHMIPSIIGETNGIADREVTAIGNVSGDADGCYFYAAYGTQCASGDWSKVGLDLEYWDLDIGPIGYHTHDDGNEERSERGASFGQLEPDGFDSPWGLDAVANAGITAELSPLDQALAPPSDVSSLAEKPQDWFSISVPDEELWLVLTWEGEAELELMIFEGDGRHPRTEKGSKNQVTARLREGDYRIGVHRYDRSMVNAIYTLTVTDSSPR